jgi:hypothetical protein
MEIVKHEASILGALETVQVMDTEYASIARIPLNFQNAPLGHVIHSLRKLVGVSNGVPYRYSDPILGWRGVSPHHSRLSPFATIRQ